MASYQSRYQPRRQTTVTGKIRNVDTYDRFYDIAYEALRDGTLRKITLSHKRLVVRVLDRKFDIDAARTIAPGSSTNAGNRFSGPRLDGRPGQGALYVGTIAGVLREHVHYSLLSKPASRVGPEAAPRLWKPGGADVTRANIEGLKTGALLPAGKRIHLFQLARPLRFVDLRITAITPLIHRLRASGDVARRYGIVDHSPTDLLGAAASASQDYSAARGMADAAYDLRRTTGDAGVCAFSSRADMDNGLVVESHGDPTGGLIFAIFGADSTLVSALEPVRPTASFDSFKDAFAAIG
jgi:hypothetical protein